MKFLNHKSGPNKGPLDKGWKLTGMVGGVMSGRNVLGSNLLTSFKLFPFSPYLENMFNVKFTLFSFHWMGLRTISLFLLYNDN